jgi:hypothetical protein
MAEDRRGALVAEYGEVNSNFRTLTEIRFKLLGFLPLATAAGTAFNGKPNDAAGFVFPLFGLIATIGLVTYNTRNDQLYDELVRRAAFIERSLGLADGAFANRPHAWLIFRLLDIEFVKRILDRAQAFANRPHSWLVSRSLGIVPDIKWTDIKWKVDHRTGVGTIYVACIAVWLFLLLTSFSDSAWAQTAALGLAVIAAWCARTWIKKSKKRTETDTQTWAAEAVQEALSTDLLRAAKNWQRLIEVCAKLGHEDEETIRRRARFYVAINPDSSNYYLPGASKELAACHFVALLTDLPPWWLFDCATNRRGSTPEQSLVSFAASSNEPR